MERAQDTHSFTSLGWQALKLMHKLNKQRLALGETQAAARAGVEPEQPSLPLYSLAREL